MLGHWPFEASESSMRFVSQNMIEKNATAAKPEFPSRPAVLPC